MKLWVLLVTVTAALIGVYAFLAPSGGPTPVTDVVQPSVTVRQLPAASDTPAPSYLPTGGEARTIQIGL